MDTSMQRLLKIKKYIFWINAHTPIAKSLKKTEIAHQYIRKKGPSIKVS